MSPGSLPSQFAGLVDEVSRGVWLPDLFTSLTRQSRVALRSSYAARAVLDGLPAGATEPPRPKLLARIRALARSRGRSLSLRAAAHLVTMGIVLLVILSAYLVPPIAILARSPGRTALLANHAAGDVQIQRQLAPGPALGGDGLVLPAARAPQEQLAPAFVESHVLAEGETLAQVAADYQVSVASLFWANDLASGNVFGAGQELRIPRLSGLPHVVEQGETLESIAQRYNVRPQAITLFRPNGVSADGPLPLGREIFIPGGALPYPDALLQQYGDEQGIASMRAVAAGMVQEGETNLRSGPGRDYPKLGTLDAGRRLKLVARHDQWVKVEDTAGQLGWVRSDLLGLSEASLSGLQTTNDFPPPPPRWVWPTSGEITSPFGWRSAPSRSYHDGLDIANVAWTKIRAARTGTVYEAGWCSGFGYCVKIDHGGGVTTIYGHMIKKPPVKAGETVEAGDLIGYMGSTYDRSGGGYSTGVHLHFTIKVNGKAVNPLKFLP